MKLFEITPSAEIVEPEITGDEVAFAYLGTKYAALLVGDEMPDGTTGLVELDMTDADLRAAIVADLLAVGSEASFTPAQRRVYEFLERPTHAEYRTNALAKIDGVHAKFMWMLTGNATTEERDTWPAKVAASQFLMTATDEAAEAAIALITSDDPAAIDDLETLVQDVGPDLTTLRTLAVTILTKSRSFKRLIGLASRLRREAKEAITGITDDAQPIEGVGAALDAIEQSLTAEIDAAIAEWQGDS